MKANPSIEVHFQCPGCTTPATYRGEYHRRIVVVCGQCGEDVTLAFKREFFKGIAADINARLVERENGEFLRYLSGGWPGGSDNSTRKR